MSQKPLETLKLLFQDRPDVLRLLDLRELDLSNRLDAEVVQAQSERELFPQPVNLYATGRTSAGKTTLATTFIDPNQALAETIKAVLPRTGKTDCTWMTVFFQMRSNLRYFDLPGAGGCNETYENINRATLLLPQIDDEDDGLKPISNFELWNLSDYPVSKQVQKKEVSVSEWQAKENQQNVSPDIILYVVAPHRGFVREDGKYLRALLRQQAKHNNKNKVIFALNIFYNNDGSQITTQENIEDATDKITKIFQEFYPNELVPIVQVNCSTGRGVNQITQIMCGMLPDNKIGNMGQALSDELKEIAKKERSRRYRKALIYIASRLATERVDTPLGKGILNEAYAAVCDYGINIFLEEDARAEMEQELYQLVDEVATRTKTSRAKAIETMVDVVEYKQEKEEIIAGWDQEYEDVEVEVPEIDYREKTQSRVETVDAGRSAGRIAGGATAGGLAGAGAGVLGVLGLVGTGVLAAATGGAALLPVIGTLMAGGAMAGGAIGAKKQTKQITVNEDVIEPVVKKVTKIERRLAGMKARKEEVIKDVPYTVQKLKKVGEEFIQGGYPVVENLLAIGLGIESANSSTDGQNDFNFEDAVKLGQQQVQATLSRYRDTINQLAESNDPDVAEAEIIKILTGALLK